MFVSADLKLSLGGTHAALGTLTITSERRARLRSVRSYIAKNWEAAALCMGVV